MVKLRLCTFKFAKFAKPVCYSHWTKISPEGLGVAAQGGEEGRDVQVRVSGAQLQLQEGGLEGVHRQTLSSGAQGLQARLHFLHVP